MRTLLFTAGLLACGIGFAALKLIGDPALLQGGLTLGGAWVICSLFSLYSKWHGIIGGGILALLGAGRNLSAPSRLADDPTGAPLFQCFALALCLIVLIATLRVLLAERTRRQLASMMDDDGEVSD